MIRTLLAATVAIGFAGTAMAGPSTNFTVKLESPMPKAEKIVAAKAVWSCAEDTCVAELNRKKVSLRTCKKVAKEVGKVAAFSNASSELTAEQLAACNAAAK